MFSMNEEIQTALQCDVTTSVSIEIGLVLLIAALASFVGHWLLLRVQRGLSEDNVWGHTLIDSVIKPLHWVIWVSALLYVADEVGHAYGFDDWKSTSAKLRQVVVIMTITWFALAWRRRIEAILLRQRHEKKAGSFNRATINAFSRLAQFLIISLGALSVLHQFVDLQTFLTFGGISAIAAGYSVSDIVKNFFGGFVINITRPFSVGDWINSPEKSIEGTVEQIGWYQTRIRTFDKRPLYVPNGMFPSIVVCNPSRMSNRRIRATIGIRYDDVQQVGPIVEAIQKMLENHPAIDQKMMLMVHFVGFGPHSLDINVYCFTKTTDWKTWRTEQQDVFLRIAEIIDRHGAEVAFPTQVVKLEQEEAPPFK